MRYQIKIFYIFEFVLIKNEKSKFKDNLNAFLNMLFKLKLHS